MKAQKSLNHLLTAELVNTSMTYSGLTPEAVLDKLRLQLKATSPLLGSYLGKSLGNVKSLGDDIIKFVYHLTYDNYILDFTFLYLQSRGNWQIQNFKINEREESLLQVA